MPRIIEVLVSAKGETTVQTKGYTGTDCLRASRFLEEALGIAKSEDNTAEYYQQQTTQQHVQQ